MNETPSGTPDTTKLEKQVDQLNADYQATSSAFSGIIRTLGTGLALITYGFFTAKDQTAFLEKNIGLLSWASILGLLALVADGLQYFIATLQADHIRSEAKKLQNDRKLTPEAFSRLKNNEYTTLRKAMFFAKATFAVAGLGIVLWTLATARTVDLKTSLPQVELKQLAPTNK